MCDRTLFNDRRVSSCVSLELTKQIRRPRTPEWATWYLNVNETAALEMAAPFQSAKRHFKAAFSGDPMYHRPDGTVGVLIDL